MFGSPKDYETKLCYAFDDSSISSSKKKKLGLGTYENRELLKEKGFKWDAKIRHWYRECDESIASELKPFGIEFNKGILRLASVIWEGKKEEVGDGIVLDSAEHYKKDSVLQFMWKDDKYGDIIRMTGGKALCNDYKEFYNKDIERLNNLKQRNIEKPKLEYIKNQINNLEFKLKKDKEIIDYLEC